jgi:hypothetical protein
MAAAVSPAPIPVIQAMAGTVVARHGLAFGIDPIRAVVPLGTGVQW